MTFATCSIAGNSFGAFIDGVDVRSVDAAGMANLYDALLDNRFVVLRDQSPTLEEYIAFARRWGRPVLLIGRRNRLEGFPEIIVQANRAGTPEFLRNVANHWHCDSSYEEEGATVTMLYGIESPEQDGVTIFADLAAAYQALPVRDRARYDNLRVHHATSAARALPDEHIADMSKAPPGFMRDVVQLDPVTHPLVQLHPINGRKALYGLGGSAYGIEGMDPEEGAELILELRRYAAQPRFCSRHKLMPGEVLIWDNFSVMHRATPIEYSDDPGKRRLNYRISLKGRPPA
jgi:alpha-ketoglutarate-dependent taurine dioxygenase